ncbi:hypothetical protein IRB23M11_17150 [Alkalibacterium sp. m-11]
MIIESLIAHLIGYFYFTKYPTFLAHSKNEKGHSQYSWGIFFTSLVVFGLIDDIGDYLPWLSISIGLVLGHALFKHYIMQAIDLFMSSTIQYNASHALQTFYRKNGQIIAFALHQMLFIFWILGLNQFLYELSEPSIQLFFIIIASGILLLKSQISVQWIQTHKKTVGQTLASYVILSAIVLFISQLILSVLSPLQFNPVRFMMTGELTDPYLLFIRFVLILLLLMRPANLLIRTLSVQYDPKGTRKTLVEETTETDRTPEKGESGFKGAGAMIGNLERILIFLSFLNGSLLSIVAILSIKAFARYKLIADDPYFSEYFVIGTMLSVLITFLSYLILIGLSAF